MPNPHFGVKVIARSEGQSVVAAAAYCSGEILFDEKAGKTFDYSRKEDVIHSEIMLPANAPTWAGDRAVLWNKVEASEKRKDAQLARNIIAALPRELNKEQNLALVRDYIQANFITKGMVADFAIHEVSAADGFKNPHAHILLTLREINQDGFNVKKNRSWNQKNTLTGWRDSWEIHTNNSLALAGSLERVSLKSYEAQGINKHPQLHLGEDAGNLEKRGIETTKGNRNRRVQHENALIEILTPFYAPEVEIGQEIAALEPAKGQMQDISDLLTADPTMRLEVMTLELKDEREEFSNEADNSSSKAGNQEASLNAFKNDEADPEKLAAASLEASRAIHEATLREYLQSPDYQTARQQILQNIGVKGYLERAKAFGEKVYQQFANLMRETGRLKARERDDYDR